jgi:hypothetical protein
MSDIEKVLYERGKRYGEYPDHAMITQDIKRAIHSGRSWDSCNPHMQETLDMIAHKIGRIVNGDPYYVDSWTDIIGYARLTEKELLGEIPVQDVRLSELRHGKVQNAASQHGQVVEVDKDWVGMPENPVSRVDQLRDDILDFQKTVYDPESTKGANIKLAEAVQLLWRAAFELKKL